MIHHKYFDEDVTDEDYSKNYEEWKSREVIKQTDLVKKEEEALT